MEINRIIEGDCLEVMAGLPNDSVDAVVTDPPYGLGFMGKAWDTFSSSAVREMRRKADARDTEWHGRKYKPGVARDAGSYDLSRNAQFQEWFYTVAVEMLRVLKPGGHLLSFGGSRTYHRMACAVEDAGFEIRDQIARFFDDQGNPYLCEPPGMLHWIYGSGFPKSLDVGKAIDKAAGVEREVVGTRDDKSRACTFGGGETNPTLETTPATPEARQWDGWGTALKPAHEPIVLARKPFTGTVAANVLEHGTGALNIEGCRVEGSCDNPTRAGGGKSWTSGRCYAQDEWTKNAERPEWNLATAGRWPANLILDPQAGKLLDEQSGVTRPGHIPRTINTPGWFSGTQGNTSEFPNNGFGDSGGASRFFYCAKASRRERNGGLDGMEEVNGSEKTGRVEGSAGLAGKPELRGQTVNPYSNGSTSTNHHPTVKPIALMRYLCKLITPPGGTILDPFAGSGTTLCAAVLEGFNYIGCELDPEYIEIAERRIAYFKEHGERGLEYDTPEPVNENQLGIFA